jgi:PAS domain S-box-containing protein
MWCDMTTGDDVRKRLSEIYMRIDELKARASKDPGHVEEILSSAFEDLEASLEELSIAEEELCHQNEQSALLASFPELNPHPIVEVDQDGRVHLLNPAIQLLFPDLQESGRRHPWLADWEAVVQAFSGNKIKTYTRDIFVGERWYQQAMYLVPGTQRIRIYGMDISEHNNAEAALRQSEEQFRAMFELAAVGMVQIDPQTGRLSKVNERFCAITGYSVDELVGLEFSELICPEDRERSVENFERAMKGNGLDYRSEKRFMHKNGSVVWVNMNAALVRNAAGQVVNALAVCEDITERKQIDEALRQSEQLYKTLAETSPALVWLARVDGTAEYVDPSWREYTGLTLEQLNKIGWTQLDHPEDRARLRAAWADCYERDEGFKAEFRFRRHDGVYRWFLGRASPLKNKDGRIIKWVGVMTDINEHKQMEQELELRVQERTAELSTSKEELEVANEELQVEISEHEKIEKELMAAKEAAEAAVEAKAAFLANMSHELRTPLNAVIGYSSLLLDENLPQEQRENIESIKDGGEALLVIISDILEFSRAEKEKIKLEHQPFSLKRCIEESMDMVAIRANKKGLDLSYTISYGTPDTIIGDPGRLRQILVNLLSNAVKFTDEGNISVAISSKVIEDDKRKITFEVRDTGIGMPQDKLDQIFKPFTQLEYIISRKRDGVGLGLAISKKLVELMGGKIWAESEEGKGSIFRFTIQAETIPGRHSDLSENDIADYKNISVQNPLSILVAEDNPSNQKVLVEMLKRLGYRADAVANGVEVLQALKIRPYDLIFMDIRMPEMDGLTATRVIRKLLPNNGPMVIAITAFAMEGDRERCFEAGMDDYIDKPVKLGELAEVISRYQPHKNSG